MSTFQMAVIILLIAVMNPGLSAEPPKPVVLKGHTKSVSAWVWDAGTGKALHSFSVKPSTEYGEWASAADVAVSPDGKRLATAGSDKVVRVWDGETGKELVALPSSDRVGVIAFSPDGQFLAAGSKDGSVRIWAVPAAK